MRFSASLHRRFESDGAPYVWLAESASVLRLDDLSDEILRTFSAPGGTDAEQWLAARTGSEDLDDARTTLRDLASFGALRPTGEKAPPAPKIPPGPFPLSTLVLNVTNKCNLSCTYCYEFGADRIADDSSGLLRFGGGRARPFVGAFRADVVLSVFVGEFGTALGAGWRTHGLRSQMFGSYRWEPLLGYWWSGPESNCGLIGVFDIKQLVT